MDSKEIKEIKETKEITITNQTKFFKNPTTSLIKDSLTGLCILNQNLVYYEEFNVVVDKNQINNENVKVICGGGSGHEPSHSGYVLNGMLSGAVCGDIFSSPTYKQVVNAIKILTEKNKAGCLLVIKNYTGDVINFKLASEIMKKEGKKVECIVIDDDISLINDINEEKIIKNKRRGLAGTSLFYKIVGSMSALNHELDFIVELGNKIKDDIFTIGVSLSSCNLPDTHFKDSVINGMVEIGLGIHGEKGLKSIKFEGVDNLIELLLNDFNKKIKLDSVKDCIILLNNLGTCSDIEFGIITNSLYSFVKKSYPNLTINRLIHGRIMTSIDMKGFSITIMPLTNYNKDDILKYIDYPVNNSAWNSVDLSGLNSLSSLSERVILPKIREVLLVKCEQYSYIRELLRGMADYLKTKSEDLNTMDKEVGDGDLGFGVTKAAEIILAKIDFLDFNSKLKTSFYNLAESIADSFGGTSGPLYAVFLLNGAECLVEEEAKNTKENWLKALKNGFSAIQSIGNAELGDRTMIDFLIPLYEEFSKNISLESSKISSILETSIVEINEKVKLLQAKKGRSVLLQGKEIGLPEPGCELLKLWTLFIIEKLKTQFIMADIFV